MKQTSLVTGGWARPPKRGAVVTISGHFVTNDPQPIQAVITSVETKPHGTVILGLKPLKEGV